jgi:GPH family glycoside/pentoside/hexuronide:cation symporter
MTDSTAQPDSSQDRSEQTTPTLNMRTKLAFGIGSTAETLSLYSYGALVILYYNQILGLEVWMAGLAPTIAIFVDAISDPFMGSFSDRWHSKRWGRRHPFMFIAPIPIALAFWCVYNPPAGLSENGLFFWLTFWAIALRTFMTIYHVPHLALGGELSSDYNERSKVMSYNNFFGWLGGGAMFKLNTLIFFASGATFANGLLNPDAYPVFSASMAVVVVFVLFSSAWFTKDRIPFLPQPPDELPKFSPRDFVADLVTAFSNRNYLFLMIAYFCLSLMLGIRGGLGTYMSIYYWELASEQIGTLVFASSLIGYVVGFMFAAKLHGRFDKRSTIVVTAVALSVFPAMSVTLRIFGWFPENGTYFLLTALIFFAALGALAGSILNISVMSALADIADEIELKHGLRQEGILYAARTFFAKLDNSIGHGIATLVLWAIEFPKAAKPGMVDEDIIWWLGFVEGPTTILAGLIAAGFYAQYRIDKDKYEATKVALAEQRAR